MSEPSPEPAPVEPLDPAVVDIALKVLARAAPTAFFRLADIEVDPSRIRHLDVTVAVAERRADHVFLVTDAEGTPEWGLYLEGQMQPQRRTLRSWTSKWANLGDQQDLDLILLILYLQKGDRATFPDRYSVQRGNWGTELTFETIRLWEHADRIRSGELPEFAPLLILWENDPGEEVIQEERAMIHAAPLTTEERGDLLSLAYVVGTKFLVRAMLDAIFGEELPMLKNLGIISDWMEESEARGEARGRADEARQMLTQVLELRFGSIPAVLTKQVEEATLDWCHSTLRLVMTVESYEELMSRLQRET